MGDGAVEDEMEEGVNKRRMVQPSRLGKGVMMSCFGSGESEMPSGIQEIEDSENELE